MQIEFTIGNDKILLRSDAANFELCQLKNRIGKDGEAVTAWEPFKWLATLPQALSKVLDMKLRASQATDLKQLRDDLEKARVEIMTVWNAEIKPL